MFTILGLLFVALQGHAEISSVLESKTALPSQNKGSKFRPRIEWTNRSQAPVTGSIDGENEYTMENIFGLHYKVAKKQKVGIRFAALRSVDRDGRQHIATDEIGDAHIRWVDSRYKGLFNDQIDIILTHKFYIPLRERSIERTEITHY